VIGVQGVHSGTEPRSPSPLPRRRRRASALRGRAPVGHRPPRAHLAL